MIFTEWTDNQRRVFIDTSQIHEALTAALREARSFRGGMHWKKSGGRQYLFRSHDRFGNGKSLGPRSPETERILADFRRRKSEILERTTRLRQRMAEQARFCRAAKICRVPRIASAVLRLLDQRRLLGRSVIVVGTHSLFAYEAAAGIFLDRPIMSTEYIDLLWDTRHRLKLIGDDAIRSQGLMGILKKADKSFEPVRKRSFRAANQDGFMVDLIKTASRSILETGPVRWGEAGDLRAAEVRNLQWLVSAPKFRQTVIGEDGFPAPLAAPDPRAFVLHKFWLAKQPDRDPQKKQRDQEQAVVVFRLVTRFLPNLPFRASELRMFPLEIVEDAMGNLPKEDIPPGFEEME